MNTALASINFQNATSRTSATRRALVALSIVVLLAVSFVVAKIPAAAAHGSPSSGAAAVVRPNWGHCSTPGVPC